MEAGAIGERIRVLNPVSRAVVEAEVIGPDRVRVAPDAMPSDGECAMKRNVRLVVPALACLLLVGCGSLSRLSEVGRAPAMTPTADPTKDPTWRPVSMPMPASEPTPNEANALWRSGSRAFFKDQRAAQVGDIVTILVSMNDTANLKNATTTNRTSGETGKSRAVLRHADAAAEDDSPIRRRSWTWAAPTTTAARGRSSATRR